jgi:SAM-dependent methyltransferase
MNTAFSNSQYELAYPQGIEHHWWSMARSWVISRIVSAESSGSDVFLEVGCGKGVEVKRLRDAGINAYGVELAQVTPLEPVASFVESGMDALDLPLDKRKRVTGLLLLDVIEHLPDPQAFLRSLRVSLPNLSVVIITVPAGQEVWSDWDEFYGHHRRYSLQMLKDLSSELGWRQHDAGYFFRLPYFPARLMSFFGIVRNTKVNPPASRLRWMHRLIFYFCSLDYWILPKWIKGTSAFAIFRLQ